MPQGQYSEGDSRRKASEVQVAVERRQPQLSTLLETHVDIPIVRQNDREFLTPKR